jgi:hypothetical protein
LHFDVEGWRAVNEPTKKRQRAKPAMVHTAVVLPPDMIEQLKQAERGLSEEIRGRLRQSLDTESKYDRQTRELAENIMELAALIPRHAKAEWHQHPEAHAALKKAIQVFLEARVPQASPIASGFARGMQEAEACGNVLATNFIHDWLLRQKGDEELEALRARVEYLERQSKRAGGKS